MSPVTHFLVGWMVANVDPSLERRERACIAAAGVLPDLDAIGAPVEMATRDWETPLLLWSDYHHVLGHNLLLGLLASLVTLAIARRRLWTTLLVLISFHLHLLGDVIGGRGPDGYQWPVYYLYPFTRSVEWSWSGQWALNAWPNFVITGLALGATFHLAWSRGFSPLELVSKKADEKFVAALRRRFPRQDEEQEEES